MKIDKREFKSLIKECLIEILAEGFYPSEGSLTEKKNELKENIQRNSIVGITSNGLSKLNEEQKKSLNNRTGYLDKINFNNNSNNVGNDKKTEITQQLISRVTKDPIMSEIFADTAASTLREQAENNSSTFGQTAFAQTRPADQAAKIVAESDPTDLFGSSASKWANLAFTPKINR
jgi:hypothetical protein